MVRRRTFSAACGRAELLLGQALGPGRHVVFTVHAAGLAFEWSGCNGGAEDVISVDGFTCKGRPVRAGTRHAVRPDRSAPAGPFSIGVGCPVMPKVTARHFPLVKVGFSNDGLRAVPTALRSKYLLQTARLESLFRR
jgi:hypothetical protein